MLIFSTITEIQRTNFFVKENIESSQNILFIKMKISKKLINYSTDMCWSYQHFTVLFFDKWSVYGCCPHEPGNGFLNNLKYWTNGRFIAVVAVMSNCVIDRWNTLLDAGKPGMMACTLTIRFLVKSFRTSSILVSRCLEISFEMSNTDERHRITTIQYFWSILITSSPNKQ